MRILRRVLIAVVLSLVLLIVGLKTFMHLNEGAAEPAVKVDDTGFVRVRNIYVDVYGVRTSSAVAIFDAAVDTQGTAVDVLLKELGAKREDVTDVFLTHGHFDHIGSTLKFPNARIHGGAADADLFDGTRANPRVAAKLMGAFSPEPPSVKLTDRLEGEKNVELAGGKDTVTAIPMPGHSPGSYAYVFRGVLIAGDAVNSAGDHLEPPIAAFCEDIDRALQSAAELPAIVGKTSAQYICTGHGGCTAKGKALPAALALTEVIKKR